MSMHAADRPDMAGRLQAADGDAMLSPRMRIFVAGHRGLVGSAIVSRLRAGGFDRLVTRSHAELDLTDQQAVREFFRREPIDYVVLAAARVGGIHANSTFPAEFIAQNLQVQTNVIHEAWRAGIDRLLFLGSSCIYPRMAPQPMREEHLLSGPLEPTNEPYAIAKIAGIAMCEAYNRQYGTRYRAVMPTNLYGPGDSFHLENSHVIPAMLRKYHLGKLALAGDWQGVCRDEATFGPIPADLRAAMGLTADGAVHGGRPRVVLWGTGQARREFLHVEDLADAVVFVMGLGPRAFLAGSPVGPASVASPTTSVFVNIGAGRDQTIAETARMIAAMVGYTGETVFDPGWPDGTPRKMLDVSRLSRLGWRPNIDLGEGLRATYAWYLRQGRHEGSGEDV